MIEFSLEHSVKWLEIMQAYQKYRAAIFNECKEEETVKYQDLFMELGALIDSRERNIDRRLLVKDFLRSTDMWDIKAILLVCDELIKVALVEQEEVAAWAREFFCKIKSRPDCLSIAYRISILANKESLASAVKLVSDRISLCDFDVVDPDSRWYDFDIYYCPPDQDCDTDNMKRLFTFNIMAGQDQGKVCQNVEFRGYDYYDLDRMVFHHDDQEDEIGLEEFILEKLEREWRWVASHGERCG